MHENVYQLGHLSGKKTSSWDLQLRPGKIPESDRQLQAAKDLPEVWEVSETAMEEVIGIRAKKILETGEHKAKGKRIEAER